MCTCDVQVFDPITKSRVYVHVCLYLVPVHFALARRISDEGVVLSFLASGNEQES